MMTGASATGLSGRWADGFGLEARGNGAGVPPLCGAAGALNVCIKGVEVILQAVCGAGGGPVVADVL